MMELLWCMYPVMGFIGLRLGASHFSSDCNLALCSFKFLENAEMTGRLLWCILELAIHQTIILQRQYVYILIPPFNTAFFVMISPIETKLPSFFSNMLSIFKLIHWILKHPSEYVDFLFRY